MIKQYKSDALAAVHETALGLAEAGILVKQTMKAFDEMCLTPVEELSPEQIREICSATIWMRRARQSR